MNSWKKILLIVVPLMVVVAAPLVLRDSGTEGSDQAVLRLDVITPHTETLRREFGEAFADYWQKKTGESVYVNFLVPGGTSECVRVIGNGFEAARERGASGCNIDVFFGGGAYDFAIQAKLTRPSQPGSVSQARPASDSQPPTLNNQGREIRPLCERKTA